MLVNGHHNVGGRVGVPKMPWPPARERAQVVDRYETSDKAWAWHAMPDALYTSLMSG